MGRRFWRWVPGEGQRAVLRSALVQAGAGATPTKRAWEAWRTQRQGWPGAGTLRNAVARANGRAPGRGCRHRASWPETMAWFGLPPARRRRFPRDTTRQEAMDDVLRVSRELGHCTEVCGYREYQRHPTKRFCAETVKAKLQCRTWRHVQIVARPDGFREWDGRGSALEGWRT